MMRQIPEKSMGGTKPRSRQRVPLVLLLEEPATTTRAPRPTPPAPNCAAAARQEAAIVPLQNGWYQPTIVCVLVGAIDMRSRNPELGHDVLWVWTA